MKPWPKLIEGQVPNGPGRYQQLVELSAVAAQMKDFGVRVDQAKARWHLVDAERRGAEFTERFLSLTGLPEEALGDAGAGQTQAIKDYFWKEHKAPVLFHDKKTKKPKFDSPTLIGYASDFRKESFAGPAAALLGIRKAKTAAGFARAYIAVSGRYDGRIHFALNVIGTKGERMSSAAKFRWREPETNSMVEYRLNLQNVPSKEPTFEFAKGEKTKLALSMRDCFIPDEGCVWVKFDYDQAEARLIAYVTGDKLLLKWIEDGTDLHMENARILWPELDIPASATKKDRQWAPYREAAKPSQYALTYSMPNEKNETHVAELHQQMKKIFPNLQEAQVKIMAQRFFEPYPEGHGTIRGWQIDLKKQISRTGRAELPQNGAFLYLPDTMRGYNMGSNFFFQSGTGVLINPALIEIAPKMAWKRGDSAVLVQAHDELDIQCPEKCVDTYCDLVSEAMSRPADFGNFRAGLPAAGDIGPNWKDVVAK